jgi:tetraacyldisaccharide 4'-kinase
MARSARERVTRAWEQGLPGATSRVLGAAGGGYRGLVAARDWLYARGVLKSRTMDIPVVSIGNLTVGGTGKTPAVELAVQTLISLGHRPAIVSRGYGRSSRGVQVVADDATIRLDAEDAGDEPFMLARRLPGVPVLVGSNRHQAARRARDRFGVSIVVLDDGFQHRTIRKDLEIVMARAVRPWGNGRLLPAGPLREPLAALRRAHLIVATGAVKSEEAADVAAAAARHAPQTPVLAARYVPTECWESSTMRPTPLPSLVSRRLVAFAGIARPASFEQSLAAADIRVEEMVAFPDHHSYVRADLQGLANRAKARGADGLVTTEKDWVRLRRLGATALPIYVFGVRLELIADEAAWWAAFERACPSG